MIKYGISILSIIPLRIDSNDKSEMTSQILFGEHFKVLKENKKWSFIQLEHDKYQGWICNKQVTYINKDEYDNLSNNNKFFTNNITSKIKDLNNQTIVLGSHYPLTATKKLKSTTKYLILMHQYIKVEILKKI